MAVEAAEEMAEEFGRNYLGATYTLPGTDLAGEALSEVHGHAISWMDVESGVRAPVCAEPIFMPIDGDVTQATLNHYGPYYLVPLYVGYDQVAMVAVAAMTDAVLGEDGTIVGAEGNEFRWAATVHGNRYGNPLSPEAAIMVAASTGDALAESVPRLIRPGHDVTVTAAKWKVQLDRPVPWTIKGDGSTVESAIVYVGLYPSFTEPLPGEPLQARVFVASEDQPVEDSVRLVYEDGSTTSRLWPFREGVAVDFREVMPLP